MSLNTELQNERIARHLIALSEIGETFLKEQYRTGTINYGAIGLAISSFTEEGEDYLKLAYEALENWNYHNICAVLDYIMPTLHPRTPRDEADEWLQSLERIRRLMNSRGVLKVYTKWNDSKMGYDTAHYRLVVSLRKVEVKSKDNKK